MPDQAPMIVYPANDARDIPIDASVWGSGGTIYGTPETPFHFVVGGDTIDGIYESLGGEDFFSPMGVEHSPVARIRPARLLPARSRVSLVYQGRTVVSFETGDGPAPSTTARTCARPPSPQPIGPRIGSSGHYMAVARGVTVELGAGVFVVDAGSTTWLALGPSVLTFPVCDGERLRVRDGQLRTVFEE